MANKKAGLLGRKVGMTQIFAENGDVLPVTVVEIGANVVIQLKTADGADGYNAVQLGFGEQKPQRLNKPQLGHFEKAGVAPQKFVREIRLEGSDLAKYPAGGTVSATDIFTVNDAVDVTGTSKGRGFAGVMKRHGFKGFIRSHGTHEYFRHGGSIGTRLTPGHVLKGKKMPGQMGAKRTTVQNLPLVRIDTEKGLLYIRGGIPGPNGGYVVIRHCSRG
jgi:large subunit ribosomal protein L3